MSDLPTGYWSLDHDCAQKFTCDAANVMGDDGILREGLACPPQFPNSDSVRSDPWDSLQVLANVKRADLKISEEQLTELEPLLWNELASEYDAENLCQFLQLQEEAGQLKRSAPFLAFEATWRRDELNHTLGFARIYSLLFNVEENELFARLQSRPHNFTPIARFLDDEFKICLVIAYDEIATTRAYWEDYRDRYPRWGNPDVVEWIRLVTRDEAFHFANVLEVIKECHAERILEVPAIIDEFIQWDSGGNEYRATFVLDHEADQFDDGFLATCRRIILRQLDLTDSN